MGTLSTIKIESILSGRQQSTYYNSGDQFLGSVAIDPDMPATDSDQRPCGLLRPTTMEKFSGSEITGVPLWFITNPKTNATYLYANDGKVHTIASDLTMGTALNSGAALSSSSGNGAEYYDNYAYFAKNADIARYGPLNGSPSLVQNYWTNTLGLTAPVDTTYPSINGVEMPNHVLHRHTDNKLYFTDVTTDNTGALHYIKTTKTTVEGDTDDTSTHSAVDFGYGLYPTDIETYGNDLVVSLIEGTNTTINQKPARLTFWDTTSASFAYITSVEFKEPLITAVKNVNGVLYVFSGFATGGCRVSRFLGGYTIKDEYWFPDVFPPLPGAVDHFLNRIVWGSNVSDTETAGCVWAIGSKTSQFGMGLHNILRATGTGNNPWVTAVKYIQQNGNIVQPVIGWDDDSAKGLDKISTTYGDYNVWQSERYRIGKKFKVKQIIIPFVQAIAANMTLTVKVVDVTGATTMATINNTNYSNNERVLKLKKDNILYNSFYLQLEWSGTALLTPELPIEILIEIIDE